MKILFITLVDGQNLPDNVGVEMFAVNLNYHIKVKYQKRRKSKEYQIFIEVPLLFEG